jgi:hypothetical protein
MKIKVLIFCVIFSASTKLMNAQNSENKWVFGVSLGSAVYSDEEDRKKGGVFVSQVPRINISRYMFKNITFDAALGFAAIDTEDYTTFDGIIRYDFGTSYNNVVPYVLLGGSFISASQLTPTLNFGAGNTFWIFPNYGLNFQIMYKFSEAQFSSQFSHLYTSIGLVYSFKSRNLNPRLWDMKH